MIRHIAVFAPAKLNIYLAVTGVRADGYHNLVSLVAPIRFGDRLEFEILPEGVEDAYTCSCSDLPWNSENLVSRALQEFRRRTGFSQGLRIFLQKNVPLGAGLGGGSSDAAATLRALNTISRVRLAAEELHASAAAIGSDVPLFLTPGPVIIRGRGEVVEGAAPSARLRISGRSVILFAPEFAVDTAWAYRALAESPDPGYADKADSEAALAGFVLGSDPVESIAGNGFEAVLSRKFLAIRVLLCDLRERLGVFCGVSGSGSACFALPDAQHCADAIREAVIDAWGEGTFIVESRLI